MANISKLQKLVYWFLQANFFMYTSTLYKPSRNLSSEQDTLKLEILRSHFISVDKRFTFAASSALKTVSYTH